MFSGNDSLIGMTREYYHEFSCSYELRYYPFDTQGRGRSIDAEMGRYQALSTVCSKLYEW